MESSPSNNPWPGRIIRIGTTVVLLLVFLGLGRFSTYKLMLDDRTVDCEQVVETTDFTDWDEFSAFEDANTAESSGDYPFSWLFTDGAETSSSFYTTVKGRFTATFKQTTYGCGWLDDFGAGPGDFLIGYLSALLLMALIAAAGLLSMLLLAALLDFSTFLWNGSRRDNDVNEDGLVSEQSEDCGDPNCTCGYHRNPSRFDEEDEQWYGYCRDRNCSCVGHHDETFDEELGEWV